MAGSRFFPSYDLLRDSDTSMTRRFAFSKFHCLYQKTNPTYLFVLFTLVKVYVQQWIVRVLQQIHQPKLGTKDFRHVVIADRNWLWPGARRFRHQKVSILFALFLLHDHPMRGEQKSE